MASQFDNLLSGAWKRGKWPESGIKATIEPPQYPTPQPVQEANADNHQQSLSSETNGDPLDHSKTAAKENKNNHRTSLSQNVDFTSATFAEPLLAINTTSKLTKASLETSHPSDSIGSQRATLIAEHDAKAKESSLRRDAEVKATKEKHLSYLKELDEELEENLRELDRGVSVSQAQKEMVDVSRDVYVVYQPKKSLTAVFQSHAKKQEKPSFTVSNFRKKDKIAESRVIQAAKGEKSFAPFRLPCRKSSTESCKELALPNPPALATSIEKPSYTTTSENRSFEKARSPSFEPVPKFVKSFTATSIASEASLSQPLANISSPFNKPSSPSPQKRKASPSSPATSKKPRTDFEPIASSTAPTTSDETPSNIELDPIRPKLMSYPFCFISAWNLDVIDENLKLLRKMVEKVDFFPEAVRADKTGYFLIFETSESGERAAEKCCRYFKNWKFRKVHSKCRMGFHLDLFGVATKDLVSRDLVLKSFEEVIADCLVPYSVYGVL